MPQSPKTGRSSAPWSYDMHFLGKRRVKYVQDRLWYDRDEALSLFDQGPKVFVCVSAVVGEAVGSTCKKIYVEKAAERGFEKTEEQVEELFWKLRNEKFATDGFT
ncbi:hypothetical protein RUND412_007344 [Rhizina undulata]